MYPNKTFYAFLQIPFIKGVAFFWLLLISLRISLIDITCLTYLFAYRPHKIVFLQLPYFSTP